jgi:hypothetical protein
MLLEKIEREQNNARSGRFSKRIGSTLYEVNVYFDEAGREIGGQNPPSGVQRNLEKRIQVCYDEGATGRADAGKRFGMNDLRQDSKLTILYLWLSKDDEQSSGDNMSIQNQRQLLEEYSTKNGHTPHVSISDAAVIIELSK